MEIEWIIGIAYVLMMPVSVAYHAKFDTMFGTDPVGVVVFSAALWPIVTTFHVIYSLTLLALNKLF